MQIVCAHCSASFEAPPSRVNRAAAIGAPLYCGLACAGLARRVNRSEDDKRAAKAIYDREYRAKNLDRIKADKRAYFERTYDPAKARVERAARMDKHVAYCRKPEYRAKKAEYDRRKRFEAYGHFAEAAMLLERVEMEINARATRYEIYIANGRFTRSAQKRRRELWQAMHRN